MNELKYQVYLAATEINDMYKLYYNDIESKHQEIENSTLEFMMSIKLIYIKYISTIIVDE